MAKRSRDVGASGAWYFVRMHGSGHWDAPRSHVRHNALVGQAAPCYWQALVEMKTEKIAVVAGAADLDPAGSARVAVGVKAKQMSALVVVA